MNASHFTDSSRRRFFRTSLAGTVAFIAGTRVVADSNIEPSISPKAAGNLDLSVGDPWTALRDCYDLPKDAIMLDHGYWGVMAQPVLNHYLQESRRINQLGPIYGRLHFGKEITAARNEAAALLGIDPDELIFTRGATEALQTLIAGYHRLQPGDEVLYSDHDYDAMQDTMDWLEDRRGVTVRKIDLPSAPTFESLLESYEQALINYPKVKLLLLTHVCHRNGLVLPIKEIQAIARDRGVETIVDAAHSLGQVDFKIPDLGANFVGLSLHKWMGAPMGTGLIYIKKGHSHLIDPHFRSAEGDQGKLYTRIHTGTVNFASFLSIPMAIRFYLQIPSSLRQKRLQKLQKIWTDAFREDDKVEVLTPADARLCAGMAAFRVKGATDYDSNQTLTKRLWDTSRILTVPRTKLASGVCIRVTPAPYTSEQEMESFRDALHQVL